MAAQPGPSNAPRHPFPFGHGSTVGGKDSKKATDVLSLDYCTFRTPYEELNVMFRQSQKTLERTAHLTKKIANVIAKKTHDSTEPISQDAIRKHFDLLIKQVQDQKANFNKSMETTISYSRKIQYRCIEIDKEFRIDEKDQKEGPSNPLQTKNEPKELDDKDRVKFARYIAWHLLRCGFIDAAKELIKAMHLERMVDVEVFERIFAIEQALHARNTQPCIAWCDYHRSKLRRIGSRMEIVARQQDVITLIEDGKIDEAVIYVKKHLTPIAKTNFPKDLTNIMGAIMRPLEQSRVHNPEFHAEDRYEKCAEMFIKEAYRLYGLGGMDAFETLVQVGLASMKTPTCKADTKTKLSKQKCVVCRPNIFPLAEDLPYAHVENSIILCSMTGTLCDDEENTPFLFPSGHIFGKKAIKKLTRENGKVWDPVHKKEIDPETEVLRLYFL